MRKITLFSLVAVWIGFVAMVPSARADDELSPEVKAQLKKLREDLKSKTPKVRAAAYTAIGELGEKAKGEKKRLCEGMLDPNATVQTAAADALTKVDEPFSKVAVGLVINRDSKQIAWAKENAKDAGPLVPVLLALAVSLTPTAANGTSNIEREEAKRKIRGAIDALVTIDPNDADVNKAVITMLGNPVPELRAEAVSQLPAIKNKKQGLTAILAIAVNTKELGPTRVAALKVLPDLVEGKPTASMVKQIEAIRYDKDSSVRDEVSELLKKWK